MEEIKCEYCEGVTGKNIMGDLYRFTKDGCDILLCSLCIDLCLNRPGTCTFCGWADPPILFKYHTPGGAPICTACAEEGILNMPQSEICNEQGESNYRSGTVRVRDKTGEIIFPSPHD